MAPDHILAGCDVTTTKLEGEFRVVDVAKHEGHGSFMLLLINLETFKLELAPAITCTVQPPNSDRKTPLESGYRSRS